MKLYGYFRSSTAYRTRIALNLKGVEHEQIPVHLVRNGGEQKSDDYTALNPQRLVPALVEGDLTLTQSLAIIEWLDETVPEPALLPGDAANRAKIRAFSYAISCDIHPLQNLRVLQYLKQNFGQDQDGVNAWCQRWIGDGLQACEALLGGNNHTAPFCFGDTPTLADICLVPQVFSAHRFGVDMDRFPALKAIDARCNELPAFEAALPQNQSDFEG